MIYQRQQENNAERLNQKLDDFATDWWDEEARRAKKKNLLPAIVALLAVAAPLLWLLWRVN